MSQELNGVMHKVQCNLHEQERPKHIIQQKIHFTNYYKFSNLLLFNQALEN
jgi:hypothetical protein